MYSAHPHADPPRTLGERLDRLNDSLQSLGQQLKETIAGAISSAVASAVRDAIRSLLGPADESAVSRDQSYRDWEEPAYPDWDRPDRPLWDQDPDYLPDHRLGSTPRQAPRSRWSEALGVALQAGLCWLRHQPRRRPVLRKDGRGNGARSGQPVRNSSAVRRRSKAQPWCQYRATWCQCAPQPHTVNLTDRGYQRHRITYVRGMDEAELRQTSAAGPTIDLIEVAEFESNEELREWLKKAAPVFVRDRK